MMDEEEEIDAKVLELDISDGPKKVLDMLKESAHREVEKVYLSRAFPSPRRAVATDKSLTVVLDSIAALPKIKHLSVGYASGSFPIHLLMKALANNENIGGGKSSIDNLVLLGVKLTSRQTSAAAETLRNTQSPLRTVCLENCKSDSSRATQKPLDEFIGALSTINSLQTLSLKTIPADSMRDISHFPWLRQLQITHMRLSEASLENIGRSQCLEKLELEAILEPQPSILLQILSRILNGNQVLRHLKLRDVFTETRSLDAEASSAFFEMLHDNKSLEELDLIAKFRLSAFGLPIANALRRNENLVRLHIQTRIDASERDSFVQSIAVIAESLRFNTALKHLSVNLTGGLSGQKVSWIVKVFMDPFTQVLKDDTRFVLESLTFEYRSLGKLRLTEELQFYLSLNRAGRKKLLLGNAAHSDWIGTLISNREDVSIVFYFLSLNPLLCRAMAVQ